MFMYNSGMALAEQQTKELEKALMEKREELEKLLASERAGLDFGDSIDSGDEESDESEAHGNYLALEQVFKARIGRIEDALHRIQEGIYGICSACGTAIPFEFLKENPESEQCLACRQKK